MERPSFNYAKFILGLCAVDAFASTSLLLLPAVAQAPGALNPGVQLREQLRENIPSTPKYVAPEKADPTDNSKDSDVNNSSTENTQTFFLKAIRIVGNNTIRTGILTQPFLPLIGTEITFEQLKNAAAQSELNYTSKGYITSRVLIPQQNIKSGNITVRVVEGYIESLEVTGATSGSQAYFRKMLQPIVGDGSNSIFNFKHLERQLLLVRDFGGVRYKTVLAKGNKLGASKLLVELNTKSLSGGISANNNISSNLGTWQAGANLLFVTPTSQPIKLLAAGTYSFPYSSGLITGFGVISSPIGNKGFIANGLWSISSTSSKDLYSGKQTLQTVGTSNYWSFGISYPIILKRNSKLSLSLSGTGQNSTNDLYLDGSQISDLSTDRIRAVRLGVDGYYSTPSSSNSFSFKLSQGIGGLGSDLSTEEVPSNLYGSSTFTTARLNLARTQKLFKSSTLFTVKGTGQLSSTAVPVPEAITYGGPLYGRAFNSVYLLGDQGWAASAEISQPINFSAFNSNVNISPFIWYDYGSTQYKEGPLPNNSASTYGAGMRLNAFNTNVELGYAIPASNTLNSDLVGTGSSLLYFNAGWRF